MLLGGGGGGGVSTPSRLTTGLVVNSFVITSPTFGRCAYASFSKGKYSVGTNAYSVFPFIKEKKKKRKKQL